MICDTCNQPIEGKSVSALGKNYHPEHFVCNICKKPITNSTFHEIDGKPVCDADFEATCPICATCSKPILKNSLIAMEKYYHPEHFVCSLCKTQITSKEYHNRDGAPVCNACFLEKVADKCKGCGEPIPTRATVALNAKWHPECFKCSVGIIKLRKKKDFHD